MSIQPFLEYLEKHKGDRGLFADLRHGFSEGTEYRAWPHIAKWCNLENAKERKIWLTVAAGFAYHKQSSRAGNLGSTVRKMALTGASGKLDDVLKTFDARFRRLLTCQTTEEVCERLTGIIKAADRKGVPINFAQLYQDLWQFENPKRQIKIRWAAQYWGHDEPKEEGGQDHVPDSNSD